MALLDLDKTTIKLPLALKITVLVLAFAGGVWRFETNMSDLKTSQEDLRKEIVYKYTIEIMKINNRIDLIEARKFVQRRSFRSDTMSINRNKVSTNTNTNNGHDEPEKYPQVCMLPVRLPEYQRKKLIDLKTLLS
jgi:hypothetical protein